MLLDVVAKCFLVLSDDTVIIPIIVLGYIWVDRKLFCQTICLLLFSMIVNVALKQTFKVPLPVSISHGYAFPSGHMQLVTVFYGFLAYHIHNVIFRTAILGAIIGIGFSLIYFGYHNIIDVVGAVLVALGLIILYRVLMKSFSKTWDYVLIFFSTILLVYIDFQATEIPAPSFAAYYALLGFVFSEKVFEKRIAPSKTFSIKKKFLASLLCFSAIAAIRYGFFHLQHVLKGLPFYITQLQWLAIGFILPLSKTCHRNGKIFKKH